DVVCLVVHVLVLQLVGLHLVSQAYAASLVTTQIPHDPAPGLADHGHRRLHLRAAVATQRAERITGQALRMQAHEYGVAGLAGPLAADLTHDHRRMLTAI